MNVYTLFGNEPVKQQLGRPNTRRDDNMKMDLGEVSCEDGEWMQLTQNHAWRWVLILGAFEISVSATRGLKIVVFCDFTLCK